MWHSISKVLIRPIETKEHRQAPDKDTDVKIQDAPIFSIHTEIIQLIFELVVSASFSSAQFKTAVLLSGVCRQWRMIAINTPTLWATLEAIACPRNFSGTSPRIHLAIPRIKGAPATVKIWKIDVSHLVDTDPKCWSFFQLTNLSNLTLFFWECSGVAHFANARCNTLRYPPLRSLLLVTHQLRGRQSSTDIQGLSEIFPDLAHLSIINLKIADVRRGHGHWQSLKDCDLRGVSISLDTIITAFPNLERLNLVNTFLEGSTQLSSIQEVPSMRYLRTEKTLLFQNPAFRPASYPSLISLYNSTESSDELLAFIRRHPSLKYLDCYLTDRHVVDCAKAASQLRCICLTASIDPFVHWKKHGLAAPPFPYLETLLLGNGVDPFTAVEFEMLVKARFLPPNHPQSLLDNVSFHVKELRIIRKESSDWKAEDWVNHPLCVEAEITVEPYELASNYISLRWI